MAEKDYVEVFIEQSINKAMGKVLDLARISEMSERAFKQFDLTVKDYFNTLSRLMINDFKEKGIISGVARKISYISGIGEKLMKEELNK